MSLRGTYLPSTRQCVNLQVTGGGSDVPAGVLGTQLYTQQDPGVRLFPPSSKLITDAFTSYCSTSTSLSNQLTRTPSRVHHYTVVQHLVVRLLLQLRLQLCRLQAQQRQLRLLRLLLVRSP
jgi:hypothetical protein